MLRTGNRFRPHQERKGSVKCTEELAEILIAASEEVAKWPDWARSLDPIGETGKLVCTRSSGQEVRDGK